MSHTIASSQDIARLLREALPKGETGKYTFHAANGDIAVIGLQEGRVVFLLHNATMGGSALAGIQQLKDANYEFEQTPVGFVDPSVPSTITIISTLGFASRSTAPVTEPVAPVVKPAAPVAESVAPAVKPAAPVAESVAPVVKPAAPVAESIVPVVKPAAPVAEPGPRIIRVAVIDDSRLVIKMVEKGLEGGHYKVFSALDGEAGLQLIKQERPDIVLLDLMLPEIDGNELLRRYRDEEGIDVPIMIMTSSVHMFEKTFSGRRREDGFIGKPFTPDELKDAIDAQVKLAEFFKASGASDGLS